ncbi:EF-hand domain-containing protein [Streptomyces sp. SH5]|uniref:EF-hand domain-containing protein n=1 Tax=Streptomyces sindenensis TaxID=67363 RepID=A0ABW6ELW4_9ACTN|nr:EF-hand domain-containing protein [Streptomyces sp. SH5]WGP08202.1 EF-hand domain-containing protein [Streptomyces sp. SH5]
MTAPVATPFVHRKIDVCFRHFDTDDNGVIDREDLLTLGAQLLSKFGEPVTSPRGVALMDGMTRFWEALLAAADQDGDQRLTRDEYRNCMTGAFVESPEGFDTSFRPLVEAVMALMDTNGDGQVDEPEFQAWQEVFRTTPEKRTEAFRKLDADGNGRLSTDELLAAVRQYYLSADADATGNWLFGAPA